MEEAAIRARVKNIVATATDKNPEEISDSADFVNDLNLDSLLLLEIGVDIDYEFKLGLPNLEEELTEVTNVQQAVELVQHYLQARPVSH